LCSGFNAVRAPDVTDRNQRGLSFSALANAPDRFQYPLRPQVLVSIQFPLEALNMSTNMSFSIVSMLCDQAQRPRIDDVLGD